MIFLINFLIIQNLMKFNLILELKSSYLRDWIIRLFQILMHFRRVSMRFFKIGMFHFYPQFFFESQSLYPSLSPSSPRLSFSILCQSRCNINHLYPFESQCLYPNLSLAYPRLSFSILWQCRILLIFLNLYLLIHNRIIIWHTNNGAKFKSTNQKIY